MANFVFNIAKGRVVEFFQRVDSNDPANSAIVIALLDSTNLEAQSALEDKDNFADLVSGLTDFATNTGASRKILTDADIGSFGPDDANNRFDIDIPDQVWTSVANDGTGEIGALVIGYDSDTTSGTDTNIIPLLYYDFLVTPDGNDITAVVNAAGLFRAS